MNIITFPTRKTKDLIEKSNLVFSSTSNTHRPLLPHILIIPLCPNIHTSQSLKQQSCREQTRLNTYMDVKPSTILQDIFHHEGQVVLLRVWKSCNIPRTIATKSTKSAIGSIKAIFRTTYWGFRKSRTINMRNSWHSKGYTINLLVCPNFLLLSKKSCPVIEKILHCITKTCFTKHSALQY